MVRKPIEYYIEGITSGNKIVLGQAITIIESSLEKDQKLAQELIEKLGPNENSIRLGVSGVPGVGKSTFIEAFGTTLIEQGHKIAVLAIDPSSQRTGGSILGDKTRMETLSRNPGAFIRPSPTKSILGGVGENTREAILLCEAAGYEVIIIETVGVGQSETTVHGMVDFFLLLMLAGAGDELQGIKKGIMEMADGIAINKADGNNIKNVNRAKSEYTNALHLFAPNNSGWQPKVLSCSALEKRGLNDIWKMINDYRTIMSKGRYFTKKRLEQNVDWFKHQLNQSIIHKILSNSELNELKGKLERDISKGKVSSTRALNQILEIAFN